MVQIHSPRPLQTLPFIGLSYLCSFNSVCVLWTNVYQLKA